MEKKANAQDEVLSLRSVVVERDGRRVLDALSWQVRRGEQWVIYGPNGAGKTTLLHVIMGYQWPTEGEVCVLGQRFGCVDLASLRRKLAFVSEPLARLMAPHLRGVEVLITGGRAHLNLFAPPTHEEMQRAREIAALTATEELLEKPFAVMSTGERQRILVARALMGGPEILILDEPCAGLDLAGREFVLRTIARAATMRPPATILFTTHHVEEILPVFTHALLLGHGRVVDAGTLRSVLTSRQLSRLFGLPVRVVRRGAHWSAFVTPDGHQVRS